jgi:hypothetical protein
MTNKNNFIDQHVEYGVGSRYHSIKVKKSESVKILLPLALSELFLLKKL